MPIPDHEKVPKGKPGPKGGDKSSPEEILKRVVTVGYLMHIRGMGLTEIYSWNMDPARGIDPDTGAPIPNKWEYSYRQIHQMTKKAQKLGASLLLTDHAESLRRAARMWYDLKEKAEKGGDYKVAAVCIAQISKIQDGFLGKIGRQKVAPHEQKRFEWLEAQPKADIQEAEVIQSDPSPGPLEIEDHPLPAS